MAKTWIKMYTEAIHDRKMWKLKPIEQLTFWYLCCIAGLEDAEGQLPSIDDIAMELQMPLKLKRSELEDVIAGLEDAGLIENVSGSLVVTKFEKRQMSNLSEAEKKARYRENLKMKSQQAEDTCPENVHCRRRSRRRRRNRIN